MPASAVRRRGRQVCWATRKEQHLTSSGFGRNPASSRGLRRGRIRVCVGRLGPPLRYDVIGLRGCLGGTIRGGGGFARPPAPPPSASTAGPASTTEYLAQCCGRFVQRCDPLACLVDRAPPVRVQLCRLAPKFLQPYGVSEAVTDTGLDLRMPRPKSGQTLLVCERQDDVPQRLVTLGGHISRWVSGRCFVSASHVGLRLMADNCGRGGGLASLSWCLGTCWSNSITLGTRLLPTATPITSFLTYRIWRRRGLHLKDFVPVKSEARVALFYRSDDVWRKSGTADFHIRRTAKPVEHPQLRRTISTSKGMAQIRALVSARVARKSKKRHPGVTSW